MHIRILVSLALGALAASLAPDTFAQQLLYIHADHLDTPRLVTNGSGTPVWRWDQSEPFGDNLPNEDPDGNGTPGHMPLRFPGQYFDKETNLAYNMARDYSPETGRYMQSDPIGLQGGLNTYSYVQSSPLSFTDPEGLNPGIVTRGLAAALAAAKAAKEAIEKAYNLCKNVRCSFAIHTAHHYFGWPFNKKMCHVQLDCYVKGAKGSKFLTLRFPYSCDWPGGAGGAAAGGAGFPSGSDDGDDV